MSLIFVCIFFTISSASAANTSLANTCYDLKADFETACKQELGGLVEGNRCYFATQLVTSNWSDWWAQCQQFGGIVAQAHTNSELAVLEQVRAPKYYRAAMGMLDTVYATKPGEAALQPTACWCDSATGKNTKMSATSTWIRTRINDDYANNKGLVTPRCFFLYPPPTGVVDSDCSKTTTVLCQISNPAQNFTLTNYCLQETALEVFVTTRPVECADVCSSRPWCRSFNYITSVKGDKCQLFPWSINDDCPTCANRTQSTATCSLYNYVV